MSFSSKRGRIAAIVILLCVVAAAGYFFGARGIDIPAQGESEQQQAEALLPFTSERLQAALTRPGEQGPPMDAAGMNQRLHDVAAEGNALAQMALGLSYSAGTPVLAQNHEEAAKWWEKSAAQGRIDSQLFLAKAYQDGRGVPQDDAQAAKWRLAAAEQGDAEAQLMIGMAYNLGTGVPENLTEAEKWYRLSAAQGNAQAQTNLAMLQQVREAPLKIMEKSLEESNQPSAGE